jgi:hypothetical protein
LGIVALVGQTAYSTTLLHVALLVIGGGIVFSSSAVTGRMMQFFWR